MFVIFGWAAASISSHLLYVARYLKNIHLVRLLLVVMSILDLFLGVMIANVLWDFKGLTRVQVIWTIVSAI
jgi:hypothetical protein